VTDLPTWTVWVLSFGAPLLAFLGVLIGLALGRRAAIELEIRSKREEAMRNLRWAAELAVSDNEANARLGIAQLGALLGSNMLDEGEKDFVQAALKSVVRVPVEQIEQLGEKAQVIGAVDPVVLPEPDIRSEAVDEEGAS
jgi:hypothetical protein